MIPISIRLFDKSIHHVGDIGYRPGKEIAITTIADYQRKAEIELLTAGTGGTKELTPVGILVINNLPSEAAGKPRITLRFYFDTENALIIEVICNDAAGKHIRIHHSDLKQGAVFTLSLSDESTVAPKVVSLLTPEKNADDKRKTIPPDAETVKINTTQIELHEKKKEKKTGDERGGKDSGIIVMIVFAFTILIAIVLFFVFIMQAWNKTASGNGSGIIPEPTAFPEPTTLPAATEEPTPAGDIVSFIDAASTDASSTGTDTNRIPAVTEAPRPVADIISLNNRIRQIGFFYFSPDSAAIKDDAERKKIKDLALIVSEYKEDIILVIKGHTAMAGTVAEQQGLSLQRAQTIRDALVAQNAAASSACKTIGAGVSEPVTTDPDMAHLNRRVEVIVAAKK